jgi:GH24 family phage-related lysozyme (muramidase)
MAGMFGSDYKDTKVMINDLANISDMYSKGKPSNDEGIMKAPKGEQVDAGSWWAWLNGYTRQKTQENIARVQEELASMGVDTSGLSPEYQQSMLEGIQQAQSYRDKFGITQVLGDAPDMLEEEGVFPQTPIDVTDTNQGKLSNPEPLYDMAKEIDPGTIETKELGLMSRSQAPSNFEDMLLKRLIDEEQFKGKAYRATKGEEHLTIGYGHYGKDVKEGDTITQKEALALLRKDIDKRIPAIRKAIPAFNDLSDTLKVEIAQSWFRGGMSGSPKTIKLINKGKFEEAAEEFLNNDEYRTARERGRAGIIPRMDAVADALRNEK